MAGGLATEIMRGMPAAAWSNARCLWRVALWGLTVAIVGTAIATTVAIFGLAGHASTEHTARLFSMVAGAMFLAAGLLRIARWRLLRESRSLLMGTALVVLGGISTPLTSFADVLVAGDATSHLRAATAIVTTFVSVVLVVRALILPAERQLRATPVLVGSCAIAVGLFLLVLVAYVVAPQLLRSSMVEPPLLRGTVLAIAWFTLVYVALLRSDKRVWAGHLAPLLACLCVSEVLRINQVFVPGGWALACAVLIAIVSAVTVRRALLDLDDAYESEQAQLEAVSAALSQTQAGVDAHQAWREELTHDARNVLSGLRAALHTLQKHGERLDARTLERLRSAAMGEVGHLEDMIIRGPQRKPVEFDIAGAIRSTVETRRASGLQVEMHDFSCRVHGYPGDLATVVQNILVNAQQHAPGATVRLCVVPAGSKVHLYIADDGPGLTDEQAARIFERGSRGEKSGGSGLGLFAARTMMRQFGGDVELCGHLQGAVFVVTLPAPQDAPNGAHIPLPQQRLAFAGLSESFGAPT